jgi:serine/threonine-protein phosphatase 6 regulatory ankyrin repeat subunit A
LACTPNKVVADCLALMMPVSPCTLAPSLSFNAINHYTTSPSKSVTFDSLPVLRSEHSPYCSFNNIGHRGHDEGFYKDEELNNSDSESMRVVVVAAQEGSQGEGTAN